MYYLLLYIILSSLAILEIYINDKWLKLALQAVVYCCLLFTAGFKYETGVDWRVYAGIVDYVSPVNELYTQTGYETVFDGLDVGFNLIISVVKYFGGGLQTIYFLFSTVSLFLLWTSLRKYTRYVIIGLLVYYGLIFFYLDMSGIRQAVSLSLFFYGIRFIQQRRLLPYTVIILLATTIHWSAIILFPFYWLLVIRIPKTVVVALVFVAALIYLLKIKFIKMLMPVLFNFFAGGQLGGKILVYSTTEVFVSDRGFTVRTLFHICSLLFFLFLCYRYRAKLASEFRYYNVFYRLLLVQIIVFFLFYELPELAERIKLYFYCANIVLIPCLITIFRFQLMKMAYVGFIFLYTFFYSFTYLLEVPFTIAYHPYQNLLWYRFLNKKSTGEQRLDQHVYNMSGSIK